MNQNRILNIHIYEYAKLLNFQDSILNTEIPKKTTTRNRQNLLCSLMCIYFFFLANVINERASFPFSSH